MSTSLPVLSVARAVARGVAAALPHEVEAPSETAGAFPGAAGHPAVAHLWEALRDVRDPELPISVVDLGLVYGIRQEGGRVEIDLTFTAVGCPCMEFILGDVRERLLQEPGVDEVSIEIVWDPPWTRARLSEHGRALLRRFGVAA